jgi:hypothetical protein
MVITINEKKTAKIKLDLFCNGRLKLTKKTCEHFFLLPFTRRTSIKHFFTFFIYFFTYLISENRVPKKEFAHSILNTHTRSLSLSLSLFLSLSLTCQAIIERTEEHIYAKKGNESQNNVRRRIRTHFLRTYTYSHAI